MWTHLSLDVNVWESEHNYLRSSVVMWRMGCTDNTLIVALFIAPATL